jgi:hypothetical protein
MAPKPPPRPKLVDSALTALHQGLNPLDATIYAINHHYGLKLPASGHHSAPPSEGPPANPPGTLGKDGEKGGSKPKPKPKPPPPCKKPPPGVTCPRNFYWDTTLCRCEPLPNQGAQ